MTWEFWKSKTFWTSVIGGAMTILALWLDATKVATILGVLTAILDMIFMRHGIKKAEV